MKERASGSRRLPASAWMFDSGMALATAGVSTLLFTDFVNAAQPTPPRGILALG